MGIALSHIRAMGAPMRIIFNEHAPTAIIAKIHHLSHLSASSAHHILDHILITPLMKLPLPPT